MTTTLVDFLEARFAEDAHGATHSGKFPVPEASYDLRTLREVAAKRRIVARYRDAADAAAALLLEDVRDLATVYADHPGYNQMWRPLDAPDEIDLRHEKGVSAPPGQS